MNLGEFYDTVARRADMKGLKLGAADTRRVLSEAFLVLASMDAASCTDTLAKGLTTAKKKKAGKK